MKTRGTLFAACVLLVLGSGARGQFTPGHVFVSVAAPKSCFDPFSGNDRIWEIDPTTGEKTLFVELTPEQCGKLDGLEFTPDGSRLRALMSQADQIVEFDSEGNLSVILDGFDGILFPDDLIYDTDKNLYVYVVDTGLILRFALGNPPGTVFAGGLGSAGELAFAPDGDLYVADANKRGVLRITPQGGVSVFEQFGLDPGGPRAVAADEGGHVYVGMRTHEIFRYVAGDPGSRELLVTLPTGSAMAMTMSLDDTLIYVLTTFSELLAVDPLDGGTTTVVTTIDTSSFPAGIAVAPFPDDDGDGVPNTEDNCPFHANPDQADCDNDGTGDVCTIAECTGDPACADCDLNGKPDSCDPDDDADGTINACEACPQDPTKLSPGQCGCGTPDTDTDLDTISDCNDQCPDEDDLLDENADGQPDCLEDIEIPTLSTWGIITLALLLLAVARRVYGGRSKQPVG